MQITKDNLTIVIVTIMSQKIIDNCLNSIDPAIKKIIVENSSNQKFINDIQNRYENIECYITGENLGMGQGNNFGIKKAKTRYVMVLNPDTILKEDTLSQIFKISENLDFSILSPQSDNKEYPNYKILSNSKNYEIKENLFEVDSVDGYAMILDLSKFDNYYFDKKIFMYLENDDLCIRAKKNNHKIYVCKLALISHLGAKTVDDKYQNEIELSRNWHWSWSKFYFRKKHYGFLNALLSCLPDFIKGCLRCFLYFFVNDKKKLKIYTCRVSGFYNSFLNKRSWYRPRLD
tara:strand:- start:849 stop:1715 length:867 start_codon:yes stop_codon:yes gene_type:complete